MKELINAYLGKSDWQVKENSNMGYSLQGLEHYIGKEVTKRYWLDSIYDSEIKKAHEEGWFHIHDLGYLSAYCVGWDLEDLLKMGFGGVSEKVSSRPPKHFSTALMQIVNFLYTVQGEVAGAIAFSNFDTLLAPFIAYDGLSFSEVKQFVQEFVFNLNVSTRTGFQAPFTNLTFDLKVPKMYENKHVIVGGKEQKKTYAEFQKEMNILNKAFLEVMMEGDGGGKPFSFPIPTYNIVEDFQWDGEVTDMMMELTAKFGTPYFANFVNSDMKVEDTRSMCCRLRLNNKEVKKHMLNLVFHGTNAGKAKKRGGLFSSNPLTGSIGVVTLNLPKIGYLSSNEKEYFDLLDRLMRTAVRSLEIKRKIVEKLTEQGLYPYVKFYLRNVKKETGRYWSNHFSTLGIIGMHESLLNFKGIGIDTPEGVNFGEEVLKHILEKLNEIGEKTGNLYNLEASPAESASFRLARVDQDIYGDIIHSGDDEAPYYTNSTMLPVNMELDPFDVAEHQSHFQPKYTGGTVTHFFVGERITDTNALKEFVRKIMRTTKLPYITITPTFSICPVHGYIPGENFKCPYCQRSCEVYSRIVGYYRPLRNWNDGKRKEFEERVTFEIGSHAR